MAGSKKPPATITQRTIDLKDAQQCLRSLSETVDDVVHKSLARYLTIRSVGFIEAVRDDLADQYANTVGHERLHRRITYHLRKGEGVKPNQLLAFVGSFDPEWKQSLEEFLDNVEGDLRNKLGAMVDARNKIAHGDGEQVTTNRALQWADAALAIGEYLKDMFATKA